MVLEKSIRVQHANGRSLKILLQVVGYQAHVAELADALDSGSSE